MPELPPIELQAPAIGRWKDGGSGVDWVHVLDSGQPGPRVMVQALTHGNEICGAIALDWLLAQRFRPQRGTLTLAFANVEAFARFDPADPFPSRFVDEDYNRVWADESLFGSARFARAAPRAPAAALRRRGRAAARHPQHERALPAADGLRHGREERGLRARARRARPTC